MESKIITVKVSSWDEPYKTLLKARNHYWMIDEPEELGGKDSAAKPSEYLAGALGGCMTITMQMYAARKKWSLESVEVFIEMERLSDRTIIRKKISLLGDLTQEQENRLLQVAESCPIHKILTLPVEFEQR